MSQTVGAHILERLHGHGIRRVYGYPGDGINGILGGFHEHGEQIEFIQAAHEELAAFMACADAKLGGVGEWFGADDLTFQKVLGWAFAPVAWLIGVPWDEAAQAGTYIGEKTVLNEFVAYSDFGPDVKNLSDQTVVIVTFALAGFANFASIAIQIGAIGGLAPDRRGEVARLGLKALLAGSLVNLANAAIAGVVAS